MPDLTIKPDTAEAVRNRIHSGIDYDWMRARWREAGYTFGEKWNRTFADWNSNGKFPRYPDITPNPREIGKSRRLMNVVATALAEQMYADPLPEFPTLDEWYTGMRKAFWTERSKVGHFAPEIASTYIDAYGFGLGFVRIFPTKGDEDGKYRTDIENVPIFKCAWDRHARQPSNMRWVCFGLDFDPDDAAEAFAGDGVSKDDILKMAKKVPMDLGGHNNIDSVRVLDYWDTGIAGEKPKHYMILDDIDGMVIKEEDNPYGCIPGAFCENYMFPALARPVGMFFMNLPVSERLVQIDRLLYKNLQRGAGVTLFDPNMIDARDIDNAFSGDGSGIVPTKMPIDSKKAIDRVDAMPPDRATLEYRELMNIEADKAAGITDLEQSGRPQPNVTLGQSQIAVNASQRRGSWQTKKVLEFYERLMTAFFKVAAIADDDPITLRIEGLPAVPVNVPGNDASMIKHWIKDYARIEIGSDALAVTDSKAERQQKLQELEAIKDQVAPMGEVDRRWYTRKLLEAIDESDPEQAMVPEGQQQPGAAPQGQPPQQGQPGPQASPQPMQMPPLGR